MRVLALLAVIVLAGCATPRVEVVGKTLDFTLPKLGGGELSTSALRGKVVLVDVWATWCGPCVQALPYYVDLENALHGRGFAVIAVNVDADPRAAGKFLRETSIEGLTTVLDPEAVTINTMYPVRLMPTSFLVGRDGTVRHVHEGFGPMERTRTRERLEALLAEP